MDTLIDLSVVFIGLIFLVKMVESVVEFVLQHVFRFEEYKEHVLGYILSIFFGIAIAYYADYAFLSYFEIDFKYNLMDYVASGGIIGAGTKFIVNKLDLFGLIVSTFSGVRVFSIRERRTQHQENNGQYDYHHDTQAKG